MSKNFLKGTSKKGLLAKLNEDEGYNDDVVIENPKKGSKKQVKDTGMEAFMIQKEDVVKGKAVKPKIVNQQQLIPATTSDAIFLQLVSTTGKKDSGRFVEALTAAFDALDDGEKATLIRACKKLPLRKSDFDETYRVSMERSYLTLRNLGVKDDVIENSAPRKNFKKLYLECKDILKKKIWGKVPESALTWSTFVRIPEVEETLIHCHNANEFLVAGLLPLLYNPAYWMTMTFIQALNEIHNRNLLAIITVVKTAKWFTVDVATGKCLQLRTSIKNVPDITKNPYQTVPARTAETTTKFTYDWYMQDTVNIVATLQVAIFCDVRKAMQAKDFRMDRMDSSKRETHQNRMMAVLSEMWDIIELHGDMVGMVYENVIGNVDPKSDFGQAYYHALNWVHTYIRTAKALVFGRSLGANTRQMENVSYEFDHTTRRKYDTDIGTVRFASSDNNNKEKVNFQDQAKRIAAAKLAMSTKKGKAVDKTIKEILKEQESEGEEEEEVEEEGEQGKEEEEAKGPSAESEEILTILKQ